MKNKIRLNSSLASALKTTRKFGGPSEYKDFPLPDALVVADSIYLLDGNLGCFYLDDYKLIIAFSRQEFKKLKDEVIVYSKEKKDYYSLIGRITFGQFKSVDDRKCKVSSSMARNLVKRISAFPGGTPEFKQTIRNFANQYRGG